MEDFWRAGRAEARSGTGLLEDRAERASLTGPKTLANSFSALLIPELSPSSSDPDFPKGPKNSPLNSELTVMIVPALSVNAFE